MNARSFSWPAAIFFAVAAIALVCLLAGLRAHAQPGPQPEPVSMTPLATDHTGVGEIAV